MKRRLGDCTIIMVDLYIRSIDMESLVDRLKNLNEQGYKQNFKVKNNRLYTDDNISIEDKDIRIDSKYRIEDDSDPTHQCIVYAIRCKHPDLKGILINTHGPQADNQINNLIERISA